ncbi:type II toxin-antitoxin system VapC family toxin [Cellulosimicrobium marinum]|uniref:type II toxin-antitoxin system VapC family toxin n=1 Tax=Cellulosimicrobium marinum TaxID=1638992 RepID=UPI001E2F9570|nr:type II toxin-antitoxin system VapC family toxin [Cellulosimicrobium marinum]MCB7135381.1 type II toxin-antitoxin system VapC family toxin [Cellulosimicrobium marinum]
MGHVIVADANVVIAASNPSDVHHAGAVAVVLEHGRDGIVLHSLTMAEVLVAPARTGAHEQVRARLGAAGFRLSPEGEPSPEALALVRAGTSLKMPDACVLATAEHLSVGLATFDARLARDARARGVTVLGPT